MGRSRMTSTRLILAFLVIILVITVILNRGRLFDSLKNRVSTKIAQAKPTLTPIAAKIKPTDLPIEKNVGSSTQKGEIPSTGPGNAVYLLSFLGLSGGLFLIGKGKQK
ncbi:MAG: hypothetical protein UV09_C0012G0040 [Candidatus Gottesmanbacteria bacterium GW2011_GWA2_42_18]|uniref:Uncharacterized protein n=2 Tax=Candidatus Gottesmaniibacteriota TaxID=1752720 RepID=A0A0G1BKR4_9BACT|nr:MAG: hypothetical protein UV09_C0012G0040 [Candidatus Gottesmanbacteria bacterium GW2011_GWA2_42_18]KKS73788.1 MAG: hypothetical protein UV46_C0062G0003 [Candidatus Gottesmanbacteria bacterium GW2011_GWC2_42_8]